MLAETILRIIQESLDTIHINVSAFLRLCFQQIKTGVLSVCLLFSLIMDLEILQKRHRTRLQQRVGF